MFLTHIPRKGGKKGTGVGGWGGQSCYHWYISIHQYGLKLC